MGFGAVGTYTAASLFGKHVSPGLSNFYQLPENKIENAPGLWFRRKKCYPTIATWLLEPWFQLFLAVLFTVTVLYLVGWTTTRVVGRRMIVQFESLMERIPFVKTIYGATRKMLAALQQKPERVERIVLINFPSSEMRVVGFVTSVYSTLIATTLRPECSRPPGLWPQRRAQKTRLWRPL